MKDSLDAVLRILGLARREAFLLSLIFGAFYYACQLDIKLARMIPESFQGVLLFVAWAAFVCWCAGMWEHYAKSRKAQHDLKAETDQRNQFYKFKGARWYLWALSDLPPICDECLLPMDFCTSTGPFEKWKCAECERVAESENLNQGLKLQAQTRATRDQIRGDFSNYGRDEIR